MKMVRITANDENYSPPREGSCEKIRRASLLASHRPSESLPHEARREPRPPNLCRFLVFSRLQGCRGGLFRTGWTHPKGYAFRPSQEGILTGARLALRVLFAFSLLPFPFAAPALEARKIMEEVYRQDTSQDTTWRAMMEVFDKKGTMRQKKFLYYKLGSLGDSKTLVRFTDPAEVRGVGLLSINLKGVSDRQWMYTPAIQRIRRIAPQERSRRFLGTDFTHEDMAERVLDDFQYRMLSQDDVIEGHKTFKIESRPIAPDRSQYKFIYLWVAQDIPYVIHAEMYDERNQKVRVLNASQLSKISGIWVARRIEIKSPLDNTQTVLRIEEVHFNTGLKADLFTPQGLEKGDAF